MPEVIWYKDLNHRVYARDENNRPVGSPLEAEYWRPIGVESETSRSWVLVNGVKVPKNTVFPTYQFALSKEQAMEIAWFDEHYNKIADTVRHLGWGIDRHKNLALLRKVADVIGYKGKDDA